MLDDRIDATYYRPEYISNELRLRNSGLAIVPLKSLVKAGRRAVYFDTSTLDEAKAPPEWLPFLTADDFGADGFFLNLNARRRVSPDFASRYPNGMLRANELLVKVKGPNQITAYNERKPDRGILVSGTIWGALVRCDVVDPHYLATALSSTYAATARTRLRTNLNVEFLSPTDLVSLSLPLPRSRNAQTYIGGKVRQAERLRVFEAALEREIAKLFCIPLWSGHRARAMKTYRSLVNDMSAERMDAQYYDPAHLHLGNLLKDQRSLPLSRVCEGVGERWQRQEAEFYYLEIGEIDLGAGRVAPRKMLTSKAPSRAQRLVKAWDVLVATVRPNRKNVAIVGEVSDNLPIVASTGFAALRFESNEAAAFYHSWLRCDAATQQLIQWNAGGSYPAIEEDIPLRILVPPFSDDAVLAVGRDCMTKLVAGDFAGKLCDAAKLLVEALIDGKITEIELVDAQEALERGDHSLDRAILSRMTEDGIDVVGNPRLFADVDSLYAAIDESQRTRLRNGDAA
jgi:type I restriction enzyme S subunit